MSSLFFSLIALSKEEKSVINFTSNFLFGFELNK